MKHPLTTTFILILLFLISQLVGVFVIYSYIGSLSDNGEVEYSDLPFDQQRPEVENKSTSFLYIIIPVLIGTLILLGIIKFKLYKVWKIWFFLAIWMTLLISFATFLNEWIALLLAILLASWRILKPNVIIHNLTEIFVYAGIAAVFVPILNIFASSILLILISVYDYWAVFKSKHMVTLAKASTEAKIFPGLHVGYDKNKFGENNDINKINNISNITQTNKTNKIQHTKVSNKVSNLKNKIGNKKTLSHSAILGGGDIAFALLFTGTALISFYNPSNLTLTFAKTLIIILFSTIGVSTILLLGKKGRFYPAMPFVTLGCFIGYGIALLV